MKVETDALLLVFWRWAEMVLRWLTSTGIKVVPCVSAGDREGATSYSRQSDYQERVDRQMKKTAVFVETGCRRSVLRGIAMESPEII